MQYQVYETLTHEPCRLVVEATVVHVQKRPSEQVIPPEQGTLGTVGQYQPHVMALAERPATIASRKAATKSATLRIGA